MIIFIVLGVVVLVACAVMGTLFYILRKETTEEPKAVPITNLGEFKNPEPLQVPVGSGMASAVPASVIKEQERIKEQLEQEYAAKEASYQRRVEELEGELHAISSKAQEQSKDALETAARLKEENEQLKIERNNQIIAAEVNLIKAQDRVNSLQEEQSNLQSRLAESHARVEKLQEEAVFFKQQMAMEIQEVKKQTEGLAVENQALKISMENTRAEVEKEFLARMESLAQENQQLKLSQQELEKANHKLKEENEELTKNSEVLQWELTKSRAQMTSFERACENYQLQLKAALERTGSSDESQDKLSETNGRLQNTLEELQKQNEEFSKREKMFESELEKSRSQIAALERECERLKADSKG